MNNQENLFIEIARSITIVLFSFIGYPSIFIYVANLLLDAQIKFNLFNVIATGILFFLGGGLFKFTMYVIGYQESVKTHD